MIFNANDDKQAHILSYIDDKYINDPYTCGQAHVLSPPGRHGITVTNIGTAIRIQRLLRMTNKGITQG